QVCFENRPENNTKMEDFNVRLTEAANRNFQDQLPDVCRRFHEMLTKEDFSPDALAKVRSFIKESCKRIVEEVREKRERKRENNEKKASESDKTKCDDEGSDSDDDVTTELESNPHINRMIDVLKPELRSVVECCNTVRAWVQLQVPEMQDGNNFGVEVQGEVLEEVRRVESGSQAFMEALSLYYLARAEVAGKFAKHTGIQDYVYALQELDVKEFHSLRLIVREVRNSCVTMLDMLNKNMDKILTPRSNTGNMLV
uniref:Proteasome activator PA28 C-terminal domain-containing protein n=1 Tax=Ciona intestinalis TaxID=7719 RepID=F6Z1D9_CIOIN